MIFTKSNSIRQYYNTPEAATYQLDYDAEGNLTRKQNTSDPADTTLYTWGARNRLTAISSPDITAHFKYDVLNRRIERTVNGHTLRALYDGPQLNTGMESAPPGGVVCIALSYGLQ